MSESKKSPYRWIFYTYSGIILLSFSIIVIAIFRGKYTVTQYLVEYGDSFSAILTSISIMFLFYQLIKSEQDKNQTLRQIELDRKLTRELHQNDKKTNRLENQLKFYSPLVGRCHRFDYDDSDPRKWLDEVTQQTNTLAHYQLYSEPATKVELRKYFSGEMRGSGEEWYTFRENVKKAIIEDYDYLTTEYMRLI